MMMKKKKELALEGEEKVKRERGEEGEKDRKRGGEGETHSKVGAQVQLADLSIPRSSY